MEKAFIYWDNSNIYISAQQVAMELEGADARPRVRIDFRNMLELARADREIQHAVAIGSIPPELRYVWNGLENEDVAVQLLDRGGEQSVDQTLQNAMLRDGLDYIRDPGIMVLLTGDGSGFYAGEGFHADLERMHRRGWRIEVLSWRHSCSRRMREWAEENGKFIALDDYYHSVTFLERPEPGEPLANSRYAAPLDLSQRP